MIFMFSKLQKKLLVYQEMILKAYLFIIIIFLLKQLMYIISIQYFKNIVLLRLILYFIYITSSNSFSINLRLSCYLI